MLRTIARPVIGVLLARVALGFDRVHRATADEEEAATRLVRALERFRGDGETASDTVRDSHKHARYAASAHVPRMKVL